MADVTKARRELRRLYGIVRRAEKGLNTGRNSAATAQAAFAAVECALREVVAVEDADGVEAAAKLSDRLTDLRQRAMTAGLLNASELLTIERRVLNGNY